MNKLTCMRARLLLALSALIVLSLPGTGRAVSDQELTTSDSTCTARQTRATWVSFLGAFTQGNYAKLDAMFAEAPDFVWYSSNRPGLRRTSAARNRSTLIEYFRSRHAKADRLRLASFRDNGNGNFTYKLRRSARDYKSGAWFGLTGKGSVMCTGLSPQLIVVSVGGPGSDKP
jgi:hypothetical protein